MDRCTGRSIPTDWRRHYKPAPRDRRLEGAAAAQALLKQNPALEQSQAVREGPLLPIDATVLVGGLGPRLPEVAEHLAGQFYLQDLPEPAAGQP